MIRSAGILTCILAGLLGGAGNPVLCARAETPELWPAISREQRPWAYWWWMGSAVDEANLSRELARYREAGYGGVHIIPIYGAKGWESQFLTYLSPEWMGMLRFTVQEANRLGLGVDMTTGTGWCFGGGPAITEAEGNANVVVKTYDVDAGASFREKFDTEKTQALVAFPEVGNPMDLLGKIGADGLLNWTAPPGRWKIYSISEKFSGQKVKRASRGGEGPMLNLLYPEAIDKFLQPFSDAFDKYEGPMPRAQYHDSYEYKTEWSPVFFQQFEKRRGYRLQDELPALFAGRLSTAGAVADPDRASRVLCDYRETASDIIGESLSRWVQWSRSRGFLTRNEAHGSPGNLLDLYALADVPETEMFRADRNKLVSKLASSAAHVAGRRLVASETGTWLKEHFTETLADMKWLLDDLFLSGVNHVFYHGTCYSPDEAAWPGWVFYASYQMNPRNAVWRDARALNEYVACCQSILQNGSPDNDVLLYWPIHDFWSQAGTTLLPHMTVHARGWFEEQPFGKLAQRLWERGYQFDYVSDRQLASAKFANGTIQVPGGRYRAIVVPRCEVISMSALESLSKLARAGGKIIFSESMPRDVAGWGHLESRRATFQKLITGLQHDAAAGEVEEILRKNRIAREELVDQSGLLCIRRRSVQGRDYFIANRGSQSVDGWVPLATRAKSAVLMTPSDGKTGKAAVRKRGSGIQVFLQLAPGESIIVRTAEKSVPGVPSWIYTRSRGPGTEIRGNWQVEFISGGPELPPAFTAERPVSWSDSTNSAAQSFSGTALYRVSFDVTGSNRDQTFEIDLGQVVQSARVRLNGTDLGTLITPPFKAKAGHLRPAGNLLEVEVTSTSANRIRDLDRRGIEWKKFYDINVVNQEYRPFNATEWPVAQAGLLGPVRLMISEEVTP